MRLPPISRSHTTVLTRGRWLFATNWQALSQRHEYRSSQSVAVAQKPSSWQLSEVIERCSASHQLSESSKLPVPNLKPITNSHLATSSHIFLADALELYRSPTEPLSKPKLASIGSLAQTNSPQLSVITAQQILRGTPQLDPRIIDLLCSDTEWAAVLRRLKDKGFTLEDVSHWAWILIPYEPDKRVDRFLSRPCHKPPFVLFHLFRSTPYFSDPESFTGLLKYCQKWYSGQQATSNAPEAFDSHSTINPSLFNRVTEGLCDHASRLQPDAFPDIAELAVAYIRGIPHSCRHPSKAYRLQCQVFNGALQAVSILSKKSPYERVSHNWRATTILLSLSSSLERPLIIEEESYRAIRQVLLALPKTASERDTASTLSSSWPPYRILRDGMEERVETQEYSSRVVKAGFMMQEGGYSKKEIDLTMDVLGGMAPDGSPTIQTRANYPRYLRVEQGTWAALIRATRNAQEAWAVFKNPPEPGMKPAFDVYWELMVKLAAEPADPGHDNLPGDGREVFPFNDRNFTDFEKARINPPSIPKLVEEMFNAGVTIRGRTLAWLIRQAPNVETALEYVDHSGLDETLKSSFKWCLKEYQRTPSGPLTNFPLSANSPSDILNAIIDLGCRLQPNRTANTPKHLPNHRFYPIRHAVRLAETGWKSAHASGRAPWESIILALGRPNIMVSNNIPRDNDIEVVGMAMKVLEEAEAHSALSLDMIDSFARAVRKAAYSRLPILLEHVSSTSTIDFEDEEFMSLYQAHNTKLAIPKGAHVLRKPNSVNQTVGSWRQILTPVFKSQKQQDKPQTPCKVVQEASKKLKAAWRVLSTKASARQPYVDPRVTASHIQGYMRTLASVGDLEEMAILLCWVVRDWAPAASGDLSLAEARRLARAVIVFRAFAEPLLNESAVASLRDEIVMHSEKGGPVHWPTDEEVEDYIRSDEWGNNQNLHEVVKIAAISKQERDTAIGS